MGNYKLFGVLGALCNGFVEFAKSTIEILNSGITIGDFTLSIWEILTASAGTILIIAITAWLIKKLLL